MIFAKKRVFLFEHRVERGSVFLARRVKVCALYEYRIASYNLYAIPFYTEIVAFAHAEKSVFSGDYQRDDFARRTVDLYVVDASDFNAVACVYNVLLTKFADRTLHCITPYRVIFIQNETQLSRIFNSVDNRFFES